MNKNSKVHEKFLYEIWKKQNFNKSLISKDGRIIKVIKAGTHNKDFGGPDFINAKIKIDNQIFVGDVEIDFQYSDWKTHGHNINKKYNKVILHIVFYDSLSSHIYTQEGRKIPTVTLENLIDSNLKENIQRAILSERKNRNSRMPCKGRNEIVSEEEKLKAIFDFGIVRFKKKCRKIYERLKEISFISELNLKEPIISYDLSEQFHNRKFTNEDFKNQDIWHQLLYENIFEALGYSKNKDTMLNLSRSADINFLKELDEENFIKNIEAALFNISGLIPDVYNLPDEETSTYTRELYDCWSKIKNKYDGKTFHAAQWNFFKLRPQNFPTIRIAGGARLLNSILNQNLMFQLIKNLEGKISQDRLIINLRSLFIIKSEGFWSDHYIFDQPSKRKINYFIGVSRADEIIVNVVLPLLYVYFEIFGKKNLIQKIIKAYINYYQQNENSLVKEVSETLKLNDAWKRTVLHQGMIEIFKNLCIKKKCLECGIGKKIFI
ncbi:MAG: DUF2851 family protein [Ignavibacteriaceae bacterium]